MTAATLPGSGSAGPIEGTPPYPPSTFITELKLDWSTFQGIALGSDNWATTPVPGGQLYGTWGDGSGLGAVGNQAYVSIGLASLTGSSAGSVKGENLIGGLNPKLAACFPPLGGQVDKRKFKKGSFPCQNKGLHGKSYSIIALGSQLYMYISPGSGTASYAEARLYRATVGSAAFTRASWALTNKAAPALLQPIFTQGDTGSHVYAYATRLAPVGGFGLHDGPNGAGEIHLLRAPRSADLLSQGVWEFFSGTAQSPAWSKSQSDSKPVFVDPAGVGWTNSAIRVNGLGRYLLATEHEKSHVGKFGIFEATDPWGPWTTIAYFTLLNKAKKNAADSFYAAFLPNSFSADGTRFTFVFSGAGASDALNLLNGSFVLGGN